MGLSDQKMKRRSRQRWNVSRWLVAGGGMLALVLLFFCQPAQAFQFKTNDPDLKITWDNTLKYSAAFRVKEPSEALTNSAINSSNVNQDDGDRNFKRGLISNRVDLFSEFDAIYKSFGLRLSGAAWYDSVYNRSNNNDSASTANAMSVANDQFTSDTVKVHGKNAELLDAFVFGKKDIGSVGTSFRLGQFAQTWGESLFFGNNGIAGGMAPVDLVKLLTVPNSQFKEIIRPVPQVSGQVQFGSNMSVSAYYQFAWKKSRFPGVGSYFSFVDALDAGGERMLLGVPIGPIVQLNPAGPPTVGNQPEAWFRGDDLEAKNSGQGGLQVRFRPPGTELDLGLYAIQYHDKTPQVYARMYKIPGAPLGLPPPPAGPPVFNPGAINLANGKSGEYYLVYPENIQAYGVSASTTFGNWNWASEISMRFNTPLVSMLQAHPFNPAIPGLNVEPDNDANPAYAIGQTMHAQISWMASFGPSFISREASFLGEIAGNRLMRITKNEAALDPNTDKDALGLRVIYQPMYRQVFSGVDLSIPIGFSYNPKGRSSVVGFGPDKGGDMSIGISGSYLDAWRFSLSYTHFYGSEEGTLDSNLHQSMKQMLADRDFTAFSIYRTF